MSVSSSGKYQGQKELGSKPYICHSSEYIFIIFIFFPTPWGGPTAMTKQNKAKQQPKNQNKPPKPPKKSRQSKQANLED